MSWKEFCTNHSVPKIYQNCRLDDLCNLSNTHGYNFMDAALRFIRRPFSLILQGDPGRGKTHFLFVLLYGLFELQKMHPSFIRYFNAEDLDCRISEEIKKYASAFHFLNTLVDNDFLFIDDFGVEASKEKAERNYYSILDKRLANDKPTILSTNLNDTEILTIFGSRIDSRLKQCVKIVFDGPDLRKPRESLLYG